MAGGGGERPRVWFPRPHAAYGRRVAVRGVHVVKGVVVKDAVVEENCMHQNAVDVGGSFAPEHGVVDEDSSARGRVVLESPEELKSTWEHRAVVGASSMLMGATFWMGISSAQGASDYAWMMVGGLAAYVMADLGSGIYHWGVDNYGDASTPVFGGQIAAFQGHHKRPWTITEREFCNNVHKVFAPAIPVAAALLVGSVCSPGLWSVWSSSFLFLVCMSQQFHAWSHMKKSELPGIVSGAQDAGLLISRKDHGAHHKAPFDGNYCIVSGICNPILDMDGSDRSFFRALERFIHETWGVEPRCWYDPDDEWMEEARV